MELRKTILFISPERSAGRLEIQTRLQKLSSEYDLRLTTFGNAVTQEDILDGITATIFDCEYLGKHELEQVLAVANATSGGPILVTTKHIALSTYRRVDQFKNIVVLQKPFHSTLFEALLQKACSGDAFKPAVCPRFITDQPVRLLILKGGCILPTRMRNYSAGGVFLEYRGISLAVGDEVAITLDDAYDESTDRHLQHFARVVWVRDGGAGDGTLRGVGLQFVNRTRDNLQQTA